MRWKAIYTSGNDTHDSWPSCTPLMVVFAFGASRCSGNLMCVRIFSSYFFLFVVDSLYHISLCVYVWCVYVCENYSFKMLFCMRVYHVCVSMPSLFLSLSLIKKNVSQCLHIKNPYYIFSVFSNWIFNPDVAFIYIRIIGLKCQLHCPSYRCARI